MKRVKFCAWRECGKEIPAGGRADRKFCPDNNDACKDAYNYDQKLRRRGAKEDRERAAALRGPKAHPTRSPKSALLPEIEATIRRQPYYSYGKEPYATVGVEKSEREKVLAALWHKRRQERRGLPPTDPPARDFVYSEPPRPPQARRSRRPPTPLTVYKGGKEETFTSSAAFNRARTARAAA